MRIETNYIEQALHVNLNSGDIWREEIGPDLIRKLVGGRGIAAKQLWDELEEGIHPFSEENVLIFSPGLLCGTNVPCAGRTTVTTKSPATNLYCKTSFGGHFGVDLKMIGVDYLIIHGISDTPVYLWLTKERAELRNAGRLWGKGVRETTNSLRKSHGNDIEVACIGPGGENKVKFASIMNSYYSAAARGGAGVVMGAKGLKAIALYGKNGKVEVANPKKFKNIVCSAREALYSDSTAERRYNYGTSGIVEGLNGMGIFPSYNFKKSRFEGAGKISGQYIANNGYLKGRAGCGSCIFACHRFTAVEEGKYKGTYSGGPEYETVSALGSGCGLDDIRPILRANEICNDMGLDTISTGGAIQWAMESYERGVLTKEDTEGIDLKWGNGDAVVKLVGKIALREGIGDILAKGIKKAAEEIGGDSWKWAIQTRGLEQSRVETRGTYAYALSFAVNPRGPDHLHSECGAEFGGTPEAIETIRKITGNKKYAAPNMLDKRAEIVRWHEDIFAISDALGICAFTTTASYGIDEEKSAKLFQYFTGIEKTPEEILKAGQRIVTLERCFNIREGQSRKDDLAPWRIMHEKQNDLIEDFKEPIITQEKLDLMLDDYFQLHGWDQKTGKPLIRTLKELQLDFAVNAIYSEDELNA